MRRLPLNTVTVSRTAIDGTRRVTAPQSGTGAHTGGQPLMIWSSSSPARIASWPMITVSRGRTLLPYVWSPCWCVLAAVVIGAPPVAAATAARNAVRALERGARVDDERAGGVGAVVADTGDRAGVVQPPRSVGLDPGPDAADDLVQRARIRTAGVIVTPSRSVLSGSFMFTSRCVTWDVVPR